MDFTRHRINVVNSRGEYQLGYRPHSIASHLVMVDSLNRDRVVYGSANDFELELPRPLDEVESVELVDLLLPIYDLGGDAYPEVYITSKALGYADVMVPTRPIQPCKIKTVINCCTGNENPPPIEELQLPDAPKPLSMSQYDCHLFAKFPLDDNTDFSAQAGLNGVTWFHWSPQDFRFIRRFKPSLKRLKCLDFQLKYRDKDENTLQPYPITPVSELIAPNMVNEWVDPGTLAYQNYTMLLEIIAKS